MRSCGCRARAGRSISGRQWIVAAIVQKIVDALHDTIAGKKAEISVR